MRDDEAEGHEEGLRLLRLAVGGDQEALGRLLSAYRDRLKRVIGLRLSRRLSGRVDDSDVLQEAFLEIARKLGDYARDPKLPPFLWMRHLTALQPVEVHRRHLGSRIRDADREVTLYRGRLPMADSASLAAQLLGPLTTDREIVALKHFEQLSLAEIAQVLGLSKAGAGSRYLRAVKRLRSILERIPGFEI
jgi:RNA polymerase sigma-70 factor (ECF subfamily)